MRAKSDGISYQNSRLLTLIAFTISFLSLHFSLAAACTSSRFITNPFLFVFGKPAMLATNVWVHPNIFASFPRL